MGMGCSNLGVRGDRRERGRWALMRLGLVHPLSLMAVVGLVAILAAPAWAGRVVDIRVGQHAGYSRIVFELDSQVGYKVERHSPKEGVNELVISLDAVAKRQTLTHKLQFIERIDVEPQGDRSMVHVRLKGSDLRLKEMILAKPPRLVFDVLSEVPVAAAKSKPSATVPSTPPKARKPAEEIAAMDLGAADWVVLSGCDTGLGKLENGEGVLGLRRAFHVAGARTVIMSLWSVEDTHTRRWIEALY